MQAADTRVAGRHLAAERGAFEREPEPPAEPPSTAPLREFLSEQSWREVLKLLMRLQRAA